MKGIICSFILINFFVLVNAQQDSLYRWAISLENLSYFGAETDVTNLIVDNDNNVYYYGHFSGSIDFDPSLGIDIKTSKGLKDLFITKFDSLDNYVFTLQIGGAFNEYATRIAIDQNNEILIAGHFSGRTDFDPSVGVVEMVSNTNYHLFCARYSVSGSFINAFSMETGSLVTGNASAADEIVDIEFDSFNNIVLLGNLRTWIDFDPGITNNTVNTQGMDDVFFAKYTPAGNLLFAKTFGGPNDEHANDMVLTVDDKIYIVGNFSDDFGDLDPGIGQYLLNAGDSQEGFLARYDSLGTFLSAEGFVELGNNMVKKIVRKDDYVISVLHTGIDERIIELDTNLTGSSATIFSDPDIILGNFAYIGNNLVTTGVFYNTAQIFSNTFTSSGVSDGFVTIGNNSFHFKGNGIGNFYELVLDHSNHIQLLGVFTDSLDLDPAAGIYNVVETSSFIGVGPKVKIRLDSSGVFISGHKIESEFTSLLKNESGLMILQDTMNNIYVSGTTRDTLDIQYGSSQMLVDYTLSSDNYFVAKFNENGVALFSITMEATVDAINFDDLNNLVLFGTYQGSADIDPGVGVYTVTSFDGTSNGQYIAKFDLNGNFISAINFPKFGVTNANVLHSFAFDSNNDLIIAGFINATNNFDLTGGTLTIPVSNSYTPFFAKYNGTANVFVKVLEESMTLANENKIGFIKLDDANRIYLGGVYDRTVDFDPGAGTAIFSSNNNMADYFFARYSSVGDLELVRTMGSSAAEILNSFSIDSENNFILGGFNSSSFDFDFGPSVLTKSGAFVAKYDTLGNLVFLNGPPAGSSTSGAKAGAFVDRYDNVFFAPTLVNIFDIDASPFVTENLGLPSNTIPILCKFDPLGNLLYGFEVAKPYSNVTNAFTSRSISISNDGKIVYLNNMNTVSDVNPTEPFTDLISSINGIDILIVSYEEEICSNFNFQVDTLVDITCQNGIGFSSISLTNPLSLSSVQWNTSPITTNDTAYFNVPGIYTVTVTNTDGCIKNKSIIIDGPPYPSGFDLNAHLISNPFRPGFQSELNVDAFNNGCVPITGELILILDPLLTFNSANPIPDYVSGDTLKWFFTDLTFDSLHILPSINVTTSTSAVIGDFICFDLKIDPSIGDMDTLNNYKNYCFPVVNGYDPNNKYVNPQGIAQNGYILSDQTLTYTINFQNTGNSEAINIFILDTLDADLDLNTLDIIGSSHSMTTEILPGNILKFKFDNIHLPDSFTNEPASHGYVIYEIDMASPYDDGFVYNTANIYFDFNPVVITNTTLNTICDEWPILAVDNTPISNLTICEGNSTTLIATGNGTINWMDENMNLIGLGSPFVTPMLDSNTVYYAFDSTCYSFSSGITFNVNVIPLPDNTVLQSVDTLSAVQTGATYQWINCNTGMPLSGANNQQYIATANGDYAVVLMQNGCSDTSACISVTGLGVSELNNNNYRLYPNPSNGIISIQTNVSGSYLVEIMDLSGKVLYVKRFESAKMEFTLPEQLSSGMYVARIVSENGSSEGRIRFVYQK